MAAENLKRAHRRGPHFTPARLRQATQVSRRVLPRNYTKPRPRLPREFVILLIAKSDGAQVSGRSAETWQEMQSAPRTGDAIAILVLDNGGRLRPFVGEWRNGWIVRIPGSPEKLSVLPRAWAPLPDYSPAFAF